MLISCLENARHIPFHVIEQLEEVDNIISILQLKKPSPRVHWALDQSYPLTNARVRNPMTVLLTTVLCDLSDKSKSNNRHRF